MYLIWNRLPCLFKRFCEICFWDIMQGALSTIQAYISIDKSNKQKSQFKK